MIQCVHFVVRRFSPRQKDITLHLHPKLKQSICDEMLIWGHRQILLTCAIYMLYCLAPDNTTLVSSTSCFNKLIPSALSFGLKQLTFYMLILLGGGFSLALYTDALDLCSTEVARQQ